MRVALNPELSTHRCDRFFDRFTKGIWIGVKVNGDRPTLYYDLAEFVDDLALTDNDPTAEGLEIFRK